MYLAARLSENFFEAIEEVLPKAPYANISPMKHDMTSLAGVAAAASEILTDVLPSP